MNPTPLNTPPVPGKISDELGALMEPQIFPEDSYGAVSLWEESPAQSRKFFSLGSFSRNPVRPLGDKFRPRRAVRKFLDFMALTMRTAIAQKVILVLFVLFFIVTPAPQSAYGFIGFLEDIVDAITSIPDLVVEVVTGLPQIVTEIVTGLPQIVSFIADLALQVPQLVIEVFELVFTDIPNLITQMGSFFTNLSNLTTFGFTAASIDDIGGFTLPNYE